MRRTPKLRSRLVTRHRCWLRRPFSPSSRLMTSIAASLSMETRFRGPLVAQTSVGTRRPAVPQPHMSSSAGRAGPRGFGETLSEARRVERSRLLGLALRPGFRLKARTPSIEPPGAGDDTSLGKQSSSCRASTLCGGLSVRSRGSRPRRFLRSSGHATAWREGARRASR